MTTPKSKSTTPAVAGRALKLRAESANGTVIYVDVSIIPGHGALMLGEVIELQQGLADRLMQMLHSGVPNFRTPLHKVKVTTRRK